MPETGPAKRPRPHRPPRSPRKRGPLNSILPRRDALRQQADRPMMHSGTRRYNGFHSFTLPARGSSLMRYDLEMPSQPSASHRVAVLLINLGTPDAPTTGAVRKYLAQFLSDPRVVEIPALVWQVILRLAILPFRSPASARKYAQVWMPEGSPLRVYTEKQVEALRRLFLVNDYHVIVDYAMRYGTPGIPALLNQLKLEGAERVLLVPMYPQYSSSTTATAFDDAFNALRRVRTQPEIRTIRQYADHPAYIGALVAQVHEYWQQHGRPDFAA